MALECRLGLLLEVEKAIAKIEASKRFKQQDKNQLVDSCAKNKKDK